MHQRLDCWCLCNFASLRAWLKKRLLIYSKHAVCGLAESQISQNCVNTSLSIIIISLKLKVLLNITKNTTGPIITERTQRDDFHARLFHARFFVLAGYKRSRGIFSRNQSSAMRGRIVRDLGTVLISVSRWSKGYTRETTNKTNNAGPPVMKRHQKIKKENEKYIYIYTYIQRRWSTVCNANSIDRRGWLGVESGERCNGLCFLAD